LQAEKNHNTQYITIQVWITEHSNWTTNGSRKFAEN